MAVIEGAWLPPKRCGARQGQFRQCRSWQAPCWPAEGVAAAEKRGNSSRAGLSLEGRGYCGEGRSRAVTVPTGCVRRPLVSLQRAGPSLKGVVTAVEAEPRRGSSSRARHSRPAPAAAHRPASARPSALVKRRHRGAGVPEPGVGVQRGSTAVPGAECSALAPRSPPPAFPGRRRASSRARPQLSGTPPVAGGPRPPPSA